MDPSSRTRDWLSSVLILRGLWTLCIYYFIVWVGKCIWCYSERGTTQTRSSEQYFRDACGFTCRWRQLDYIFMYHIINICRTMVVNRPWYTDGHRSSLCYQRKQRSPSDIGLDTFNMSRNSHLLKIDRFAFVCTRSKLKFGTRIPQSTLICNCA